MLRNFYLVTFRSLWKYKNFSFINLTGLTVGVGACILIFMWVVDEIAYDKFHANAERTYRILWDARYGDNTWRLPLGPMPAGTALKNEFPAVEAMTQLYPGALTLKHGDAFAREDDVIFGDTVFTSVFSVEVIAGDVQRAFANKHMLALTPETAEKYFGSIDCVGKTIEDHQNTLWQVAAIVEPFPSQSHFAFDMLAAVDNLGFLARRREAWSSASVYNYFTVHAGTDIVQLEEQWNNHIANSVATGIDGDDYSRFPFQAMRDIHLDSRLEYELGANGDRASVVIFSIVAIFILLLACINFVNLATVKSMLRSKEVGVRKVLGSSRMQIVWQFFAEAFIHVLIAVALSLGVINTVMPGFNELTGKTLTMSILFSPQALLAILGMVALTTWLTAAFPAFILSSFKPVQALSNNLNSSGGRNVLRKTLVVMQFCISIGLIVGTTVVTRQLQFMREADLGFNKERILVISRAGALGNQYDVFVNGLRQFSEVLEVARAQTFPGKDGDSTIFRPEQPANYEETSLNYAYTGPQYADLLDLEIVEGRNFNNEYRRDTLACLINESAANRLGWTEPVGRTITTGSGEQRRVVGVVADYHYESRHQEIAPLLILNSAWRVNYIGIKLKSQNMRSSIANIHELWNDMSESAPFQYTFLDEDYDRLYRSEQRMGQVLTIFSGLSIFIACLGLFGLASFLVARRYKEISIRKVLGASTGQLLVLLNSEFLVLVVAAFFLATPLAWVLLTRWLENFAYRIDMAWWIFLGAGATAILIALVTVSSQSLRAAWADPAIHLRND